MSSFNKLDLLVSGSRNPLTRLTHIESAAQVVPGDPVGDEPPEEQAIQAGQFTPVSNEDDSSPPVFAAQPATETTVRVVRPNLFINSGFEGFDVGATCPHGWVPSGAVALAENQTSITGTHLVQLTTGASLTQEAPAGVDLEAGAIVVSVFARCLVGDDQTLVITATHAAGVVSGDIGRHSVLGASEATDEVPADGQWYRFVQSFSLTGGDLLSVTIAQGGSAGTIEIDAAKLEYEAGTAAFISATTFQDADWGPLTHIRNLSANNILTGSLVVGGSLSTNPRISVLNGTDDEIVTIGDPVGGYYGIDVKAGAGLRISGTGSAEVTGSGVLRAGTAGAQRVDITFGGVSSYDDTGAEVSRISSVDGSISIIAPTSAAVWKRSYGFTFGGDTLGGVQGYGGAGAGSVMLRCEKRTGTTAQSSVIANSDTNKLATSNLLSYNGTDLNTQAGVFAYSRYNDGTAHDSNVNLYADTITMNSAGGSPTTHSVDGLWIGGNLIVGSPSNTAPPAGTMSALSARVHSVDETGGAGLLLGHDNVDYASVQVLDNAGATSFLLNCNRTYSAGWQQQNARIGGTLIMAGNVLTFYSFAAASSTPVSRLVLNVNGVLSVGKVANLTGAGDVDIAGNIRHDGGFIYGPSGRETMRDDANWVRFNQLQDHALGTYTPGFLRADGGLASGVLATPGAGDIGYTGDIRPYRNAAYYTAYAFVPLTTYLTSTSWDGDMRPTTAKTLIDLSAVFGVPAGIKAVVLYVGVLDTGSASVDTMMLLSDDNTNLSGVAMSPMPVNSRMCRGVLTVPCDANGDIYYQIVAASGSSFSAHIQVVGYFI